MTSRALLGFAAAVGLAVGTAAPASAQTVELGGIRGTAASSGLHVFYQPKGLLPTGPPVDLGSPDALATIASGPQTFARAGVADPGDLVANPDALFTQFSAGYPSGTVPPWPFRISANSSVGQPTADSNPAPGLRAHVEANTNGSHAQSTMPGVSVPAIANVSSVVADAATRTDGATVTTRAVTTTSDFAFLTLIHVDSVVTDLTATTDGVKAKVSGATRVFGATVAGRKVTIDAKGIHGLSKSLNTLLARAGISARVVEPVSAATGSAAQLSSAGLRIEMDLSSTRAPALDALFDALPPLESPVPGAPSAEDLIAAARAHHLVGFQVGPGAVTIDARRAGTVAVPELGDLTDDAFLPSLDLSPAPSPSPLSPVALAPGRSAATTTMPRTAPFPFGAGIAGLALLALMLQPLLGYRLARAAASLLGVGAAATCPEDEP